MRSKLVILGALVAALWAMPCFAGMQAYPAYQWESFPDELALMLGPDPAIYPDLDPQAVFDLDYIEEAIDLETTRGLLTVDLARDSYLSLVYFSPAGSSYIVVQGLNVPDDHLTTLTFVLPADEQDGMIRLLLWNQAPENGWLPLLARHAVLTAEPVPGLVADRWVARRGAGFGPYPWISPYQSSIGGKGSSYASQLPSVYARLDEWGNVVTKDGAVTFNGNYDKTYTEFGAQNQWDLDWGADLDIQFEITGDPGAANAYLLVYGESESGSELQFSPAIEVEANGWLVLQFAYPRAAMDGTEPYTVELSQYLQSGINNIELRLSAFADRGWRVRRLELWFD